jgi:hypothetical protein
MALMTEISEGFEDREVLQTVRDLGVQEIHSRDIELGA